MNTIYTQTCTQKDNYITKHDSHCLNTSVPEASVCLYRFSLNLYKREIIFCHDLCDCCVYLVSEGTRHGKPRCKGVQQAAACRADRRLRARTAAAVSQTEAQCKIHQTTDE